MPIRLRALGKEFGYSFFPMISHYFSFLGAAPSSFLAISVDPFFI
jgi:hypothetical protein